MSAVCSRMPQSGLSEVQCAVGKIKCVHCKDFVTYDECIFCPTEYLNIIIGPNGTGKSTLVSAIILGLGGEPKILSRASSIQDYIKNGKTSAQIDVEVFANDEGKSVVFHRNFNDAGRSEYKVNGDVVTKSNFLKTVAEFKIQTNNLCQFLPQDRVQDFAKLNPQELLVNTITSVCCQTVIDNFEKLKELRKGQLNGKRTLESNLQKLKELTIRQEELKQILERYNTRKEYLEKLEICTAKKQWMEVDEIDRKILDINKDLDDSKKKFGEYKRTFDEIKNTREAILTTGRKLEEDFRTKCDALKDADEQRRNVCQQADECKKIIREAKRNLEKKKLEWNERQNELRHEATMLEVIVEDLKIATANLGRESDRAAKLKTLQDELEKLKYDIKNCVRKRSDINKRLDEEFSSEIQAIKKSIERSKNVAEQKMELLRNNFADVHKAVLWLEKNQGILKGKVYNPILLELNVPDPRKTLYFENVIPLRDLLSFVCENKADISTLAYELCIKQKLSINFAHSPPAAECRFKPDEPIKNLEKYGFTAYLIDLLDGPPAVLNYICSLFKLHCIPIGTEIVNKHTDSIPSHIRQYFGGDQRYNVSISKYSKEASLMQHRIKGKNLLLSCDMNLVQTLQQRLAKLLKDSDVLKNERTVIEAKINEIELSCQEINNKRRVIESTVSRFNQLKDQCKRQEHKIANLRANIMSVPNMEICFKDAVHLNLRKIIQLQKEKIQILRSYQKIILKKNLAEIVVQLHKEQSEDMINAIHDASENVKRSQKIVDTIVIALGNWKKKREVKAAQAMKSTNNCKPSDVNFPYTKMFRELPNDMEQLNEVMNDFSARLDCMGDVNQEIVAEYERRRADIEVLQKSILENVNCEKNISEKISSIFADWYPELSRLIESLNEYFGNFMDSLNYVGEILLTKKEEFDFDSYGIEIMVQYRKNVPLQALDRHVQSGGERAVAIAVYTLSLQHITHVPFRCVDEINQGMDARNERKIFEMLVDETTKSGRSQYFFVTPKLLPNLRDHEKMTVHIVFNGKMVQSKDAFSFAI